MDKSSYLWIAVLAVVYTVGIFGFLWDESGYFVRLTPLNLILTAYVVWRKADFSSWLKNWLIGIGFLGFLAEMVGVNTAWLFGNYSYGYALGYKVANTPLMIALNWALVVYLACASLDLIFSNLVSNLTFTQRLPGLFLKAILAALMATALDFVIEPVAVRFQFWVWHSEHIPVFNYLCWFGLSLIFSAYYFQAKNLKTNPVAPYVLLIQLLFFGTLNFI
jgi:putative membrane protein